jgi:hypothetical protein
MLVKTSSAPKAFASPVATNNDILSLTPSEYYTMTRLIHGFAGARALEIVLTPLLPGAILNWWDDMVQPPT